MRASGKLGIVAGVATLSFVVAAGAAGASSWAVNLASGSAGEAPAQPLPSAPGALRASCTSPTSDTVKVAWNAVVHAGGYSVYESTTSATSGYSMVANGITSTSWTSGALGGTITAKAYWFEVSASVGNNWASPESAASGPRSLVRSPTASCS